jgi:folate-binding protein YgfZ
MNLSIYHRMMKGGTLTTVLSPRALWRLTGPDAARYLNGQVTNDVLHLAEGTACYAAVCTAKGRMEGDVSIARHGGEFYLDADLGLREGLGARLEKYLIADDAAFEDVSEVWKVSHILGVGAPTVPGTAFVISNPRFGLPGHDVWTAGSEAIVAGEIADAEVVEILRLEHGIPRWGAELSTTTLPPEAGPHMLASISYTKGCYVGQETIARLKSVGHVNRSLVFLRSDSAAFPAPGGKLKQGEQDVGIVTSSGFSPRLEKGIALGYAQRQHTSEGALLEADGVSLTVTAPLSEDSRP